MAESTHFVDGLGREQIAGLARDHHALWGTGRTIDEHVAHNLEQLRRAGPDLLRYVGLVRRGEVVASMKRYSLLMSQEGRVLRAIGVGAVFVPDHHRGKALAEEMLALVLAQAKDLAYDAAILYSDIAPKVYARLGFIALAADQHEAKAIDLPNGAPYVTRAATPADVATIQRWLESSIDPRALRLTRSRAHDRYFRWRSHIDGIHVLRDGDREVGYLVASKLDPRRDLPSETDAPLFVDEWSAPDRDRVLSTIRSLAETDGCERVLTWLRPNEPLAPFTAHRRRESLPMIASLRADLAVDPARDFLDSFSHF